jgi:hypothetical protein
MVVNTVDGTVWLRRAATRGGLALYAPQDVCRCPEFVMATEAELAEHGITGSADVLPVPVGPPSFPPPPRTELERLAAQVVELQETTAEADRDAARARLERDLMRERVSEPNGCAHCGVVQRSHGRRYISGVGMHAWERPSDEQVKARMLARRVARFPLPATPELDQVLEDLTGANLARWEEEQDNARLRLALASAKRGRSQLRAKVAELEAQRERRRVRLVALQNDALNMRGTLAPNGEDNKVPFTLGETLTPAVEWLVHRVAELEVERHTTNEALADITVAERSANRLSALLAESEPPRIRKHHPDCAAVAMAGAPCTCPPDFTGEDPDDLADEDGCTCPDTGRGEPHDVDCPQADAPGPYDAVLPAVGSGSPEMRELRAALTGSPDAITRQIAPLQALREDPHDSPLHHDWRLGRDLPETGGA